LSEPEVAIISTAMAAAITKTTTVIARAGLSFAESRREARNVLRGSFALASEVRRPGTVPDRP
jgi:hypothetical protein